MVERMSEERLVHIKNQYERWGEAALERAAGELLDEIDALRAEAANAAKAEAERLADAAFPVVPDKETKVTLAVLDVVASGQKSLSAGGAKSTADLIKRLATERDQYRQAMETYCGAMTKATAAQVESERRLATAREALGELAEVVGNTDHDHSNVENEPCPVCCCLIQANKALAALQPETKPE